MRTRACPSRRLFTYSATRSSSAWRWAGVEVGGAARRRSRGRRCPSTPRSGCRCPSWWRAGSPRALRGRSRRSRRRGPGPVRPAGWKRPCTCRMRAVTGSEPDEERRHHHLIAQHEVVDDGVMAVELPAPRLGRRRLAHHRDVVLPLAVLLEVVAVELASVSLSFMMSCVSVRPLALNDARSRATAASRCARGQLLEAHALTPVEMLVHPLPPLGDHRRRTTCGWRCSSVRLARKATAAVRTGSVVTPVDRTAKRSRLRRPGGGDAPERLGEALGLGLARALARIARAGPAGSGRPRGRRRWPAARRW